MKKFIVSLTLLGLVSIGSMAFINNVDDNPPSRRQARTYDRNTDDAYRNDGYRHHRRGGCCGQGDRRDDRRRYECCDVQYDCGACHDNRCTVEDCHRNGNCAGNAPNGATTIATTVTATAVNNGMYARRNVRVGARLQITRTGINGQGNGHTWLNTCPLIPV